MMARNQRTTMKTQRIQVIVLGSIILICCVLWQLFFIKQVYMEKERYSVGTYYFGHDQSSNSRQQKGHSHLERQTSVKENNYLVEKHVGKERKWTKIRENENQRDKHVGRMKVSTIRSSTQQATRSDVLLDLSLISNTLLREAPWAESHGANHLAYLGAGMLYYSMAYSFRSKTIVVLGSGGGFVPRMLKQAQRDLLASGVRPERKPDKNHGGSTSNSSPSYELYLVDAHLASAGWGSTFYAENENTTMRKEFSDINYIFQLTDDAYTNYFRPMYDDPNSGFTIDYLHVDADHGFEQSWKDFDNYSKLLSDRAVISFHDTCYDNVTRNCHAEGVPETIEKLRNESQKRGLQLMDLHYLYRGIAFAVREDAPAIETPRDRRINFCVNNADLINVTSDGFTKNGRVGTLPTLGDFMNCSKRYNETELLLSKSKLTESSGPPNGIMAVPCSSEGFRRNTVSGRCEKCIPGLSGENCHVWKYELARVQHQGVEVLSDDSHDHDLLHLAREWLRTISYKSKYSSDHSRSSRLRSVMEIGPNAWMVPKVKKDNDTSSSSHLLFGSIAATAASQTEITIEDMAGDIHQFADMIVVDPILVTNPLWIDPTVSSRYRFLPCTLKDAIDYDKGEKNKNGASKSSPLDLDIVDTVICLSCDDLVTVSSSFSVAKGFLDSTFPKLKNLVLGIQANDISDKFLKILVEHVDPGDGYQSRQEKNESTTTMLPSTWRMDKDVFISVGGGNFEISSAKRRLVLLTRTN